MARAITSFVVLALALGLVCGETVEVAHKGGKYYPDRPGRLSPLYDGEYRPVASDKSYTYYRANIKLDTLSYERFQPNATSYALVDAVFAGTIIDVPTGNTVGVFDATGITTNSPAAPGAPLNILITFNLEFGADEDSAVIATGGLSVDPISLVIRSSNIAVTGGVGQYLGATGSLHFNEVPLVSTNQADALTGTITLYVPKLKSF